MLSFEQQDFVCKYIIRNKLKKVDEEDAKVIASEAEVTNELLNDLFFPNKKEDELRYDTYIVNHTEFDSFLFKIRQDIIYLDNSKKLKDSIVLKKKDYAKIQKAQAKIEEQLQLIKQLIAKA